MTKIVFGGSTELGAHEIVHYNAFGQVIYRETYACDDCCAPMTRARYLECPICDCCIEERQEAPP
jgi:hypothetical protein